MGGISAKSNTSVVIHSLYGRCRKRKGNGLTVNPVQRKKKESGLPFGFASMACGLRVTQPLKTPAGSSIYWRLTSRLMRAMPAFTAVY